MLKFCVLASGSKGNSTYLSSNYTNMLIDVGLTSSNIDKKLLDLNIEPKTITSILLTHTHADHINGLKVFLKKYNPKLYLTDKMYDELSISFPITNYEIINGDFDIGDIHVDIIKTSHDAADSNGYIFTSSSSSLVYITDTGYINCRYFEKLRNKNAYIMESNHDVKLLMNGKYPYYLKQRVLSDKGHLSNEDSSYYLSEFIGANTSTIVLIHLSKENNTNEIALNTLNKILSSKNKKVDNIVLSTQEESTELITI